MSDLGFNVWGAIASGIGTMMLIPALLAMLYTRLPSTLIVTLTEMHKETQELLAIAVREGLITDPSDLYQYNVNLLDAAIRVDELRAEVYAIRTWREDVAQWYSGLSGKISMICKDLNSTRMKLAKRNSKERKMLASQGLAEKMSNLPKQSEMERASATPLQKDALAQPVPSTIALSMNDIPVEQGTTLKNPTPSFTHQDGHGATGCVPDRFIPIEHDDGIRPGEPLGDKNHSAGRPKDLAISVDDLRALISLSIAFPRWFSDETKRLCTSQRAPQKSRGTSIHESANVCSVGTASTIAMVKRRARPRQALFLLRLIRRVYGVRPGYGGGGQGGVPHACVTAAVEPESLLPHNREDTDDDSDEWEEE
ncbi:hypothetical protein BN946_scf184993.g18 [Trametes cinnabarina]|uniref:Uncharacterized protein n=1 Tax=Pycnoporus cinnabarinus TaxID=5643 RepID=A0A060STN7_PYCCI|nr:hypothetical protein BN946_scf184993.g18 [Trametes cinnabarina]